MKKIFVNVLSVALLLLTQCTGTTENQAIEQKNITEQYVSKTVSALLEKYGTENEELIQRGIKHAASLWRATDGTVADFESFCVDQFISDPGEKEMIFNKISIYILRLLSFLFLLNIAFLLAAVFSQSL